MILTEPYIERSTGHREAPARFSSCASLITPHQAFGGFRKFAFFLEKIIPAVHRRKKNSKLRRTDGEGRDGLVRPMLRGAGSPHAQRLDAEKMSRTNATRPDGLWMGGPADALSISAALQRRPAGQPDGTDYLCAGGASQQDEGGPAAARRR